jgi:hypothetical protein
LKKSKTALDFCSSATIICPTLEGADRVLATVAVRVNMEKRVAAPQNARLLPGYRAL